MKKFIQFLSICILLSSTVSYGMYQTTAEQHEQKKPKLVEIKHKEIPKNARMDIIDKYHGAEILKAHKEELNGKLVGYQIEIKKGPKKWVVIYDEKGYPKNKVQPE